VSREQQFDIRYKELNSHYLRVKKQCEHITSCIKDFHSKLYQRKKLKTEVKDEFNNKSDGERNDSTNDGNDDIIEIIMQAEPMIS
jgi:phage shock protein A